MSEEIIPFEGPIEQSIFEDVMGFWREDFEEELYSGDQNFSYADMKLFCHTTIRFKFTRLFINLSKRAVTKGGSNEIRNEVCVMPSKEDLTIKGSPPLVRQIHKDGDALFMSLDRTILYFRLTRDLRTKDYRLSLLTQFTFKKAPFKKLNLVLTKGRRFLNQQVPKHKMIQKVEIEKHNKRLFVMFNRKLYAISYTGNPVHDEIQFYRSCKEIENLPLKKKGLKAKDFAVEKKEGKEILILCKKSKMTLTKNATKKDYSLFIIKKIDNRFRIPKRGGIIQVPFASLPGDIIRIEFYGNNIVLSMESQYVVLNIKGRTIYNSKSADKFINKHKAIILDKFGGSFQVWPETFDTIRNTRFRHLVKVVGSDQGIYQGSVHDGRDIKTPDWEGNPFEMGFLYPFICYVPQGKKRFQFFSIIENFGKEKELQGRYRDRLPIALVEDDQNVVVLYCQPTIVKKKNFYDLKIFTPISFFLQEVRLIWKFVGGALSKGGKKRYGEQGLKDKIPVPSMERIPVVKDKIHVVKDHATKIPVVKNVLGYDSKKEKKRVVNVFRDAMRLNDYDFTKRRIRILEVCNKKIEKTRKDKDREIRKEEGDVSKIKKLRLEKDNLLEHEEKNKEHLMRQLRIMKNVEVMRLNLNMAFALFQRQEFLEMAFEHYFESHYDARYLVSLFPFDSLKGNCNFLHFKVGEDKKELLYWYYLRRKASEISGDRRKRNWEAADFPYSRHYVINRLVDVNLHQLFRARPLRIGDGKKKNKPFLMCLRKIKHSLERNHEYIERKKDLLRFYFREAKRVDERGLHKEDPNFYKEYFDEFEEDFEENIDAIIEEEKVCIDNMIVFFTSEMREADKDRSNKEFYDDVMNSVVANERVQIVNEGIIERLKSTDIVSFLRIKWNGCEHELKEERHDFLGKMLNKYWKYFDWVKNKKKWGTENLLKFLLEVMSTFTSEEFHIYAKCMIIQYCVSVIILKSKDPYLFRKATYASFAKEILEQRRELLKLVPVFLIWLRDRQYDVDMVTPPEIMQFFAIFPEEQPEKSDGVGQEDHKKMMEDLSIQFDRFVRLHPDCENAFYAAADDYEDDTLEGEENEGEDPTDDEDDDATDDEEEDVDVDGDNDNDDDKKGGGKSDKKKKKDKKKKDRKKKDKKKKRGDRKGGLGGIIMGAKGKLPFGMDKYTKPAAGVIKMAKRLGKGDAVETVAMAPGGVRKDRNYHLVKFKNNLRGDEGNLKLRNFLFLQRVVEFNHRTFLEIGYLEGVRFIMEMKRKAIFEDVNLYFRIPPTNTTAKENVISAAVRKNEGEQKDSQKEREKLLASKQQNDEETDEEMGFGEDEEEREGKGEGDDDDDEGSSGSSGSSSSSSSEESDEDSSSQSPKKDLSKFGDDGGGDGDGDPKGEELEVEEEEEEKKGLINILGGRYQKIKRSLHKRRGGRRSSQGLQQLKKEQQQKLLKKKKKKKEEEEEDDDDDGEGEVIDDEEIKEKEKVETEEETEGEEEEEDSKDDGFDLFQNIGNLQKLKDLVQQNIQEFPDPKGEIGGGMKLEGENGDDIPDDIQKMYRDARQLIDTAEPEPTMDEKADRANKVRNSLDSGLDRDDEELMKSYGGMLFLLLRKYLFLLNLCHVGGEFLKDRYDRCKELILSREFKLIPDHRIQVLLRDLKEKGRESSFLNRLTVLLLTKKRRTNLKEAIRLNFASLTRYSKESQISRVFSESEEICLHLHKKRWSSWDLLERPVVNSFLTDLLKVAFDKYKAIKKNEYFSYYILKFMRRHAEQLEFAAILHKVPVHWDLSMVKDVFNKKIIRMHEEIRKSEARIKVLKMLSSKKRRDLAKLSQRSFVLDGNQKCVVCGTYIYSGDVFIVYPSVFQEYDLTRYAHAECGVDPYDVPYNTNIFPADNVENIEFDPVDIPK